MEQNLRSTNLQEVNFRGALYNKATQFPEGFDPTKYEAHLIAPGVSLVGVNLSGANLSGADLSRADLRKANLFGVAFHSATLYMANFQGAFYNEATQFPEGFDPTECGAYLIAPGMSLAGLDLSGVDLSGADLSKVNLFGVDLRRAILESVNFQEALYNEMTQFPEGFDPTECGAYLIAPGVSLVGLELSGANLSGTAT